MEKWMTTQQAAAMLEVTNQAVYGLIRRGTLAGQRLHSLQLVGRQSVNDYLQSPSYLSRTRKPNRANLISATINDPEGLQTPLSFE